MANCQYTIGGKTYSAIEFEDYLKRMPPHAASRFMPHVQNIPDMPFKGSANWSMLAMKRMIQYAVDNGYDRIAWSPGEVHADRYDLSKRVSSVSYDPAAKHLTARDLQGREVIDRPETEPKDLPDLIGKEAADKLLEKAEGWNPTDSLKGFTAREEQPGRWYIFSPDGYLSNIDGGSIGRSYRTRADAEMVIRRETQHQARPSDEVPTLSGLDLRIGGEGMRGFYDRILPAEVNKLVGKFGAKVGKGEIGGGSRAPLVWDGVEQPIPTDFIHPVHQFDITPALKAVAQTEGLPLFQRNAQRAAQQALTRRPHPDAVQVMLNEAHRLLGGKAMVEAYDAAHDIFTIRFKRGGTQQVMGYVTGRLLRAAIETDRAQTQWNFDHETLHALRNFDLFTEAEWNTLGAEAKREDWVGEFNIKERYPGYTDEQHAEEAFAEKLAQSRYQPPPPDSMLARFIAKIKAFLARLRNALAGRGFHTAEDIFGKIRSGEVGRRPEGPETDPRTLQESLAEAERHQDTLFGRRPVERGEEIASRVSLRDRLAKTPKVGDALVAAYDVGADATRLAGRAVDQMLFPMRMGSEPAQVYATRWANAMREVNERYSHLDRQLVLKWTPKERVAMGRAMDAQSVFEQMLRDDLEQLPEDERAAYAAEARSRFDTDGQGIAGLSEDQRNTLLSFDAINERQWGDLQDEELVKPEAQRLPFYFPRIGVHAEEGQKVRRLKPSDARPREGTEGSSGRVAAVGPMSDMNQRGMNLTARGPKGRKWLEMADTLKAGRAKFGEEFALVEDIRALPIAWARNERALAGRRFIDEIKSYGEESGLDWVQEDLAPARGGWFTLNHPDVMRWEPRMGKDAEGKWDVAKNPDGTTVWGRVPIHISTDFKGPLEAVLSHEPNLAYQGYMKLKGVSMHAIMWSPLMHLQVEMGRAFPLMPGQIVTGRVLFKGARVIKNRDEMKRWIAEDGISPIGQGWAADPATVAEQSIAPYGRMPGLTKVREVLDNGARLIGRKLGETAEKTVQAPHQTILWDNVYRLQMGIAEEMAKRFMAKGFSEKVARMMAAFLANRYAGALPPEHLRRWVNMLANLLLFSRSYTLGNLGVIKDIFTGAPSHVIAAIRAASDQATADKAKAELRRVAFNAMVLDMGMFYILNSILQTMFRVGVAVAAGMVVTGALKEALDDWLDHAKKAMEAHNPFKLLPQMWNEPGKSDRIFVRLDEQGRGIYMRAPAGKTGEEFVGWLSKPGEMFERKGSPLMKSVVESIIGYDTLGRPVYNPHPEGFGEQLSVVGDIAKHIMAAQFIPSFVPKIGKMLSGEDEHPALSVGEMALEASGLATFSKGYPASRFGQVGPESGEMRVQAERLEWQRQRLMRDVSPLMRAGKLDEAVERVLKSDLPDEEKVRTIKRMAPASAPSATFNRMLREGWEPSATTGAPAARP